MSSAAFYNAVRPDGEFTADAEEGAMEYLVGVTLAFGISCFSTLVRFDRDRAFYPTILIVIASNLRSIRCHGRIGSGIDVRGHWHRCISDRGCERRR